MPPLEVEAARILLGHFLAEGVEKYPVKGAKLAIGSRMTALDAQRCFAAVAAVLG
ncbi:MAG: hypothetical protein OXH83_22365 [Bryobacterales bacterium]|nr:hypothetical protein [Bryobacterales bacterium]